MRTPNEESSGAGWPPFFPSDLGGAPRTFSTRGLILWLVVIGIAVGLFVLVSVGRNFYSDWLWFENLNYTGPFWTIVSTRVVLFLLGSVAFAAIFLVNVLVAHRISGREISDFLPEDVFRWVRGLTLIALVVLTIILGVVFGAVTSSQWNLYLKFGSQVPFGKADPIFGQDISFFVFSLPALRFLQEWLIGAVIVSALAILGVYFISFSLRGASFSLTGVVRVHLTLLGFLAMILFAWGHWLDRYELLYSPEGAVFGATYADVNARLLGLTILIVIALLVGVILLVSVFVAGTERLPVIGIVVWIGGTFVLGSLYPGFVQRFQVLPNEFALEEPYIKNNIAFTREAFGLDRVEERTYPGAERVTPADLAANPDTVKNIRLWDTRPLRDTLNQIQFLRLYYEFLDVDIDRYTTGNEYRQMMVGARELDPARLSPEAQTWINQRVQYTHGYGVTMSPVTEFTTDGRPTFVVKDIPPAGDISVKRPEIYFGERTQHWVIVNSNTAEFDYPTKEDIPVYTRYQGQGGVTLNSFLRRLLFAWQFGDINILISGEITPESRILYSRDIRERVSKIAPFLFLDRDPYMVVSEGALWWIQDAYTYTDRYPYSEPSQAGLNYIRNSVKVLINAYDGFVIFYIADPSDPIVQTYQRIFPTMFLPLEQMPEDLRKHIRYPEDMFRIQSLHYLRYHMRDSRVFYNKEDLWSVPSEVFYGAQQPVEPYYVIMRLPGEAKEEFFLIMPFTPSNKPNLVGWLAARNDEPNYGKLLVFLFPKDRQVDGPSQVEARINNDPDISREFTLWGQQGSRVIRGNLLVIPIGQSVMYIEPIYLQAENLAFPELKRVIVATSEKVVMRPSLQESLAATIGVSPLSPAAAAPARPAGPPASGSASSTRKNLEDLLEVVKGLQEQMGKLDEAIKRLLQQASP